MWRGRVLLARSRAGFTGAPSPAGRTGRRNWSGPRAAERRSTHPPPSPRRRPSLLSPRPPRGTGGRRRPPRRTGNDRARASGAAEGSSRRSAYAAFPGRRGDPACLIVAPWSSSPLDEPPLLRSLLGDGAHELAGALVAVVVAQLGIVGLEDLAAYPLALDDARELVHAVPALSG